MRQGSEPFDQDSGYALAVDPGGLARSAYDARYAAAEDDPGTPLDEAHLAARSPLVDLGSPDFLNAGTTATSGDPDAVSGLLSFLDIGFHYASSSGNGLRHPEEVITHVQVPQFTAFPVFQMISRRAFAPRNNLLALASRSFDADTQADETYAIFPTDALSGAVSQTYNLGDLPNPIEIIPGLPEYEEETTSPRTALPLGYRGFRREVDPEYVEVFYERRYHRPGYDDPGTLGVVENFPDFEMEPVSVQAVSMFACPDVDGGENGTRLYAAAVVRFREVSALGGTAVGDPFDEIVIYRHDPNETGSVDWTGIAGMNGAYAIDEEPENRRYLVGDVAICASNPDDNDGPDRGSPLDEEDTQDLFVFWITDSCVLNGPSSISWREFPAL